MEIRTLGTVALLIIVLFGSFLIRIQSSANIPAGQLTDPDGYFYYWQAQLISENGRLPARDMRRWLPVGRDLGQTLNLYPYVLAYTHKALSQVFSNISLYHVVFERPTSGFTRAVDTCKWLYSISRGYQLGRLRRFPEYYPLC